MTERAAILHVSPEALTALLQLPAGSHIDYVFAPPNRPGVLELRIRGAGWPVELGQRIPDTTGNVSQGPDGRITIDWGLPS